MNDLPVIVVGAGPVGLAAAAHLHNEGLPFIVLEAGEHAGWSVSEWGHVRLFSPWKYLVDDTARALLEDHGWVAPPGDDIPTGAELVHQYVRPLADHPALATSIRTGTRVRTVTRSGADKLSSNSRDQRPFEVHVETTDGHEEVLTARAVIDASGTYEKPNPLGASGTPAPGERAAADRLFYRIPDVRGRDRERFVRARVGVVGSGHSAFNTLLDLADLPEGERPHVTWFIRSETTGRIFGGEDADALSERGALGRRMRELAESGHLEVKPGFRAHRVAMEGDGVRLQSVGGDTSAPLDVVVVVTGFRPDLSILREVRAELDPTVEAPSALAPLIDPNIHSCGTVPPHGYRELSHPETDFYVVGMKSYGRAPTFLLLTGYEQVRSVVKALSGDLEAAANVQLVLPETGVCGTDVASDAAGQSCCAPASESYPSCSTEPQLVSIGLDRSRS